MPGSGFEENSRNNRRLGIQFLYVPNHQGRVVKIQGSVCVGIGGLYPRHIYSEINEVGP
jgi:hypothetical protein